MNSEKKRWLLVLPLGALVLLVIVAVLKPSPKRKDDGNLPPLVDTQVVANRTITPFVTGYGRARPKQVWQAVSEVSGRVIYRHPSLQQGQPLPANTVLLKVDPTDYELKLAQAKSDLSSAQAELTRTELNEEKLALSLQLEQQQLTILSNELKRKQGLLANGSVSKSSVDVEQRNVLVQKQKVLDLENSVKQFPSDLAVVQAKVELAQSKLMEAQRKLDKTVLTLPFNGRLAQIDVEIDEVINEGQTLVVAHKADIMEVQVQVPMSEMRFFRRYAGVEANANARFSSIQGANIRADVTLMVGNERFTWNGTLSSIGESIDTQGNTVLMIVDIDLNSQPVRSGGQPPLINDMYVEAKIFGKASQLPVIPVDAVRGDRVYTLDKQGKLIIKPVLTAFEENGQVAITQGLEAGDTLVLSDVIPPIEGMTLRTQGTL